MVAATTEAVTAARVRAFHSSCLPWSPAPNDATISRYCGKNPVSALSLLGWLEPDAADPTQRSPAAQRKPGRVRPGTRRSRIHHPRPGDPCSATRRLIGNESEVQHEDGQFHRYFSSCTPFGPLVYALTPRMTRVPAQTGRGHPTLRTSLSVAPTRRAIRHTSVAKTPIQSREHRRWSCLCLHLTACEGVHKRSQLALVVSRHGLSRSVSVRPRGHKSRLARNLTTQHASSSDLPDPGTIRRGENLLRRESGSVSSRTRGARC